MPRSSGRSGGGRAAPSHFGSAPSRSAHTSAAPTTTRTATRQTAPPPAVAPANAPAPTHSAQPPAPYQQAPSGGGGMMSGLAGTIMQGMAFGGGSAMAHRAVDSIAGPRTVVHEHQGSQQGGEVGGAAAGATTMAAIDSGDKGLDRAASRVCGEEVGQFQKCMTDNRNDFNACSFYFDVLSTCQKAVKENAQWK